MEWQILSLLSIIEERVEGIDMGVLEGLKPESVFCFFEEISRIPRGSGNEKQISDYLKNFAQERGLPCIQDKWNNIIIIKEATPGYEQAAPYILQGHMDMVTVKEPDCAIDMTKDPLRLYVKDGRVSAKGTSLGGDDGIAVAYMLALLDAREISHPRLEMVITTEEETGLTGAHGIDLSMLRGRQLINLDNEEEGVIITSCAGGARVDVSVPVRQERVPEGGMQAFRIHVKGLLGGHSGTEIDKRRGNANCILGGIMNELAGRFSVRLTKMQGGQADNAIPREASAVFVVPLGEAEKIRGCIAKEADTIRGRLQDTDPDFCVECREYGFADETCLTAEATRRVLSCLTALPNGIIAMSGDIEGLVQTSLNLGVMRLECDALLLAYAVRSSVDSEKEELCGRMQKIAEQAEATATVRSSYPGWAYRKNSPLRDKAAAVYERMYGSCPKLQAIHAGLECGLLAAKIPGLDCISIGPDMADVHTTQESLSVESVDRVWEYLLALLAEK